MTASNAARPFSHTSRHARCRLRERCAARESAVLALLDAGAFIDLGRKPGCDRHHLLFWSAEDNAAKVALRDCHTGTLVTVLPLDFQANLAWKVTEEQVALAKRRAAQRLTGEGRLHLRAHFLDDAGMLKTKSVWHSALTETPASTGAIEAFVVAHRLMPGWRKALVAAGMHHAKLLALSLRRGGGERIDVPEALVETVRRKLAAHA